MKDIDINKLLDIGIALSKEKDAEKLLETILVNAMEITNSDGGTLYINNQDSLVFRIMITKSMGIVQHEPVDLPPVPLSRANVCACAVVERKLINIPDVYRSESFDFTGTRRYDAMTGYRSISMLVVPMEDDEGGIMGVLQLINAKDEKGETIPFDPDFEQVVLSLASQAAICLTNMSLSAEITALFDSFVRVMSTAIDARSSYTADHTRNMVRYASGFIAWLRESENQWQFSEVEERQFLMSVWLHDVGKLVVPLEIMDKETRLGAMLPQVLHRFEVAQLTNRIDLLSGASTREEFEAREELFRQHRELVIASNTAPVLEDETIEKIKDMAAFTYVDSAGITRPFLSDEELASLTIKRGTLSEEERRLMQEHVSMTRRMLDEMAFSKSYKMVPEWASSHHEFIDGTGYPLQLKGDEVSREVRLLTIIDIYDALTAKDRPYKKAMPPDQAFATLRGMAKGGKLDSGIVELFFASNTWKEE